MIGSSAEIATAVDPILVVDDLPDDCFLLQTALESEGYEVEVADNDRVCPRKHCLPSPMLGITHPTTKVHYPVRERLTVRTSVYLKGSQTRYLFLRLFDSFENLFAPSTLTHISRRDQEEQD